MTDSPAYSFPTHGHDFRQCTAGEPRGYIIDKDKTQIRFLPCRVRSGHPHDIAKRFCGYCKAYLADAHRMAGSQ